MRSLWEFRVHFACAVLTMLHSPSAIKCLIFHLIGKFVSVSWFFFCSTWLQIDQQTLIRYWFIKERNFVDLLSTSNTFLLWNSRLSFLQLDATVDERKILCTFAMEKMRRFPEEWKVLVMVQLRFDFPCLLAKSRTIRGGILAIVHFRQSTANEVNHFTGGDSIGAPLYARVSIRHSCTAPM